MEASQKTKIALRKKQDPEKREKLRAAYREGIETLTKSENVTPEFLLEYFKTFNVQFEEVTEVPEAVQDTTLLKLFLKRALAEAMREHAFTFDPNTVHERVIAYSGLAIEEGRVDWAALGTKILGMSKVKVAPSPNFLYGPLAMDATKRVHAQRERQKNDEKLVVQNEISDEKKQEMSAEEETTARIQHIYKTLYEATSDDGPVPLFQFILHPTEFGQSIENIFHLSFLVRDGHVNLSFIDGLPHVAVAQADRREIHVGKETVEGSGTGTGNRKQLIFSLSTMEWRELVDAFHITEAMVKPLPYTAMLGKRPKAGEHLAKKARK